MRKIKPKNTSIEQKIERLLPKGYEKHRFGADFVYPKQKIAVRVMGCFWHKCPLHYTAPKSNVLFWRNKIRKKVMRDKKVRKRLENEGWKVIDIWEHNIRRSKDGRGNVEFPFK